MYVLDRVSQKLQIALYVDVDKCVKRMRSVILSTTEVRNGTCFFFMSESE